MYNTKLEAKIDGAVKRWKDVDKKKMFGGVCYLLKGNMCFGIHKDSLIVRMDKDLAKKSLKGRVSFNRLGDREATILKKRRRGEEVTLKRRRSDRLH